MTETNEHDRRFNRGDLLHAWLEERKYQNAHEKLRDYHGRAAKAYGTAFGIDLAHPPGGDAGDDALSLYRLLLHVVESRQACGSPFAGYMAAPRIISDLYQSYGKRLEEDLGRLIGTHDELLLALMGKIWETGVFKDSVTREELRECGHPDGPEPDPIDYW